MNEKYYGYYKDVRNAAWQFLIDFNITELPINIYAICERMGIQAKPYEAYLELLETLGLEQRAVDDDGFSIILNKQWYIFYKSDYRSYARMTFVVLHEIAHILLGHKMRIEDISGKISYINNKSVKTQIEKEADMFAIRIMSPACVLKELNLHTPEEIMEVCQMPYVYAEKRASRMKILYKRNMFYSHPLERQVRKQFSKFIIKRQNNWRIEISDELSIQIDKVKLILNSANSELI